MGHFVSNRSMEKAISKSRIFKRLIMLIIGFTVLIGCAAFVLLNLDQTQKPVLVIIGDSNSDQNSQVQVEKWSQIYAFSHDGDVDVHNLSLGGHAVEDFIGTDTFQALTAIADHVGPNQPVFVVTMLGTNNAIMSNKLDTPENFSRNYAILLTDITAILKPKEIIVGSIPPALVRVIPGTKTPTDPGAPKLIPELNRALESWVAAHQLLGHTKLSFVKIMPNSSYVPANSSQYFIADGIHLNPKGQATVYDILSPIIDETLRHYHWQLF